MKIIISNQSELPIYAQIREQLKEQILNGQIPEGETLPSIRQLAKEVGVSVITTTRACFPQTTTCCGNSTFCGSRTGCPRR